MPNIVETSTWEDGIYQLEQTDLVLGGEDGIDNLQAKQLANRTQYLKDLIDTLSGGLGSAAALAADPDASLTANSDLKLATQKAVKTYVDGLIAANDAMVFKGIIDCSANPNYPAADRGHTYRVSVAGKIGGAAGPNVEAGDMLMCLTDGAAAGNHATVGAQWGIIQANLDGALLTTAIGVTVQGYDATLAALAAVVTAADKLIYATGPDTFATTPLSAFIRTLLDDANAAAARATLGIDSLIAQHGQCVLVKSGANLLLKPMNGNKLLINGAQTTIPDVGVSLSAAGLTAGTVYYIYAYMNAGVMTLEASATGHSVDATSGVEIKTGDVTRTLVGMARPIAGPSWQDTSNQRFVLSWFHQEQLTAAGNYTANRTTASSSYVELNSEIRAEFLCWGYASGNNRAVVVSAVGGDIGVASGGSYSYQLNLDGAINSPAITTNTTNTSNKFSATWVTYGIAEGYHYATIFGQQTGGGSAGLSNGTQCAVLIGKSA